MINFFNFEEIWIFFRYKTFPIFLGLLFLSSFFYAYWAYLQTKKKPYLFLSLASFVFFLKEFWLFFATRRLLVDFSLPRIAFTFEQWMIVELLANFMASIAIGYAFCAFRLQGNMEYISFEAMQKKLKTFFILQLFVVALAIALVVLLDEMQNLNLIILMPVLMAFYFVFLRARLQWTAKNFYQFDLPLLARGNLRFFNAFIFLQLFIFSLFTLSAFFYVNTTISANLTETVVFELLDSWVHPFKTLAYFFLAGGIFTAVRAQQLMAADKIENKEKLRAKLQNFEKDLQRKTIDLVSPKEIFDSFVAKLREQIQPDILCIKFTKQNKELYVYHNGELVVDGRKTDAIKAPYVNNIFDGKKNIVIDDISTLSPDVKNHFSHLPSNKSSTDVAAYIAQKQKDYAEKKQKEEELYKIYGDNVPSFVLEKMDAEDEEEVLQDSEVKNLLYAYVEKKNSPAVAVKILAINKLPETNEAWNEAERLAALEVIAEKLLVHWHYFLNFEEYQKAKSRAVDRRVLDEMEQVVGEIDKVYVQKSETKKNMQVDYAYTSVYGKRRLRNFFRFVAERNNSIFIGCDVVGNAQWTFLFHSILQSSIEKIVTQHRDPVKILEGLNEVLLPFQSDSFVNAAIISYSAKKQEIVYANAGYLPLLVFHENEQEMVSYDLPGTPLGIEKEAAYEMDAIALQKGDIVVFQSENLLQQSGDERGYSVAKLAEMVKKNSKRSAEAIAANVIEDIKKHFVTSERDREARMLGIVKIL